MAFVRVEVLKMMMVVIVKWRRDYPKRARMVSLAINYEVHLKIVELLVVCYL